ncbi:MAG: polyribonucleotide nucleotidyltransferase, partial [Elusimicrobiota bacterium]
MQVFETDFGGRKFSITTDYVAKQAAGSAWVRYGDTVILATVCVGNRISEGFGGGDCLPLTVDYRERTYAAGKIPGGFFKREGKPREREVLFSRLTDRTIRPLFPSNFKRDIQVACSLLSADLVNDSDVMLIIGASVASMLSGVPFAGPVAAVRIGVLNGEYIVNPSMEQTDKLELDIIVSGTKDSVMMIEGGAAEASEEVVSKVFELAQQEINRMVEFQKQIVGNVVVKEYPEMQPNPEYQEFENKAKLVINPLLDDFLKQSVTDKKEFSEKLNTVKTTSAGQIVLDTPEKIKAFDVVFFEEYHKKARKKIIDTRVRLDGRKPDELRNITCAIGVLPRTHGSALFTRGNTQALATVTLGTPDDMQIMDELAGEYKEHFLLHYNF